MIKMGKDLAGYCGNSGANLLKYLQDKDCGSCEWLPLNGYEKRFLISSNGVVYSLSTFRQMKLSTLPTGYVYLPIMLQIPKRHVVTAYIHRLVALTFIPNPYNKPTVNHIDGDKSNNSVSNLEWATMSEQNFHAIQVLHHKRNTNKILELNHSKRVFSADEVLFIRSSSLTASEIVKTLGKGSEYIIHDIRRFKTSKDI